MESPKKKITFPVSMIFRYYWESMRPYKWQVVLTFVAYGLGSLIANVMQPLVFRRIIDIVSSNLSGRELIAHDLWWWFGGFALVMIIY